MISTWMRRKAARKARKNQDLEDINGGMELVIPNHFRCPISLDLMKDPVTMSTGITYDRESIEKWIEVGNLTCPVTHQVLRSAEPIPNHTIRRMIQDWCVDNRSHGIERIPTPRVPVTSYEVSEILSKFEAARRREDAEGCLELVRKIKSIIKESDRNKRCIVVNGTSKVLSATFEAFSKESFDRNGEVMGEILSALTMTLPLDGDARSHLGLSSSLRYMVWFLRFGNLSGQRNAVLALKEIISSDEKKVAELAAIEGAIEAVFKLVKKPICPTTTKASLLVLHHMVSSSSSSSTVASDKVKESLVEMGMVEILLEMFVESDRSICEKALGVLDGICDCHQGREKAYSHALTVPVLVKKLLRVSELATKLSVSVLWKLFKNAQEESVIVEALQVGAFQKLLVLLQVGCGVRTKEKVTELLKMLNLHKDRLECIDSMDFQNVKRSF